MLRLALLGLSGLACALLAIAEFLHLNTIKILTVAKPGVSDGGHHGYALLIIAVVAAIMALGAWRGSRPAAFAVAGLGAAALIIVLAVDLPDVDATGLYGRNYESAKAVAASGFKLSSAGAVLLLFAGVSTVFAGLFRRPPRAPAPRRPARAAQVAPAAPTEPATAAPPSDGAPPAPRDAGA